MLSQKPANVLKRRRALQVREGKEELLETFHEPQRDVETIANNNNDKNMILLYAGERSKLIIFVAVMFRLRCFISFLQVPFILQADE